VSAQLRVVYYDQHGEPAAWQPHAASLTVAKQFASDVMDMPASGVSMVKVYRGLKWLAYRRAGSIEWVTP
jgi:hypothetical protein